MIAQPATEQIEELKNRWKEAKGKLQQAQAQVAAAYGDLDPVLDDIRDAYGGDVLILINRRTLEVDFCLAEDHQPVSGVYIAGTTFRFGGTVKTVKTVEQVKE